MMVVVVACTVSARPGESTHAALTARQPSSQPLSTGPSSRVAFRSTAPATWLSQTGETQADQHRPGYQQVEIKGRNPKDNGTVIEQRENGEIENDETQGEQPGAALTS